MSSVIRTYPGARRPDRIRQHDADGIALAVYEWGRATDPVVFMVHGGSDFAGTFDVFAPLIADAGWRVVAWDARGHGDSEHASLYSWEADIRDALSVMGSITDEPVPVVAHSKGGAFMMHLLDGSPYRASRMVNIDGMPSKRSMPDVPEQDQTRVLAGDIAKWLDYRHDADTAVRKPGTFEELAGRRAAMNPRLSMEWLEYLVTIGAREDADGWRWKLDPTMRFGGFGPWHAELSALRMVALSIPFLGILGTVDEPMGWGARPRDLLPWIPAGGRLEVMENVGHFIHIEEPLRVSQMVLEFLS